MHRPGVGNTDECLITVVMHRCELNTDSPTVKLMVSYIPANHNYGVPCFPFPSDSTLTSSKILHAVRSLVRKRLSDVLELPVRFDEQSKEDQVAYYLKTSPYASWEHIGGELLYHGEDTALQEVKEHIKPGEGQYM